MAIATQYLMITLAAPLASFGTVAVGERRPTWDRPSKSQVVGLVAACLGIERSEEQRQRDLTAALGFAVRVDHPGLLATDYHTAQAPKEVSIRRRIRAGGVVATRADELACDDPKTILSRREFRTGALHTIALWRLMAGEPDLAAIGDACRSPAFVPFAGRKAHALSLPLAPRLITADSIEAAYELFDAEESRHPLIKALKSGFWTQARTDAPIYVDASAIPASERTARVSRIEERRDYPESRAKWRFSLRAEALLRDKPIEGQPS